MIIQKTSFRQRLIFIVALVLTAMSLLTTIHPASAEPTFLLIDRVFGLGGYNQNTDEITGILPSTQNTNHLDYSSSRNELYVLNRFGLGRINTLSGEAELLYFIPGTTGQVIDFAVSPSDQMIYTLDDEGLVGRIDPDNGTELTMLFDTGRTSTNSIAFDPTENIIYWSDAIATVIEGFDLDVGGPVFTVATAADGLNNPNNLDYNGLSSQLYWTNGADAFRRTNADGSGTIETVGPMTPAGGRFNFELHPVADAKFYTSFNTLNRETLAGTGTQLLYDGTDGVAPSLVAVDTESQNLYMNTNGGTALFQGDQMGVTPPMEVYDSQDVGLVGIAGIDYDLVDDQLYWGAQFSVYRKPRVGSELPTVLFESTNNAVIESLAVDETNRFLYWSSRRIDGVLIYELFRAPLDGGDTITPELLYDSTTDGLGSLVGLEIDPSTGQLYWGDRDSDTLVTASADGTGAPVVLFSPADGVGQISAFTIDSAGGRMFWGEEPSLGVGGLLRSAALGGSGAPSAGEDVGIGITIIDVKYRADDDQIYVTLTNFAETSLVASGPAATLVTAPIFSPMSEGFLAMLPQDQCPTDPLKLTPRDCGCGTPDVDEDNDGILSCLENCPLDPNKTEPLQCGCGQVETDSDSDGTPDCLDSCPADPAKIAPGNCGCGLIEDCECTTNDLSEVQQTIDGIGERLRKLGFRALNTVAVPRFADRCPATNRRRVRTAKRELSRAYQTAWELAYLNLPTELTTCSGTPPSSCTEIQLSESKQAITDALESLRNSLRTTINRCERNREVKLFRILKRRANQAFNEAVTQVNALPNSGLQCAPQ